MLSDKHVILRGHWYNGWKDHAVAKSDRGGDSALCPLAHSLPGQRTKHDVVRVL